MFIIDYLVVDSLVIDDLIVDYLVIDDLIVDHQIYNKNYNELRGKSNDSQGSCNAVELCKLKIKRLLSVPG